VHDAIPGAIELDWIRNVSPEVLFALSFALRLVSGLLGPGADPVVAEALAGAERALAETLAAVRGVANGLFPATLASAGLAPATTCSPHSSRPRRRATAWTRTSCSALPTCFSWPAMRPRCT